MRPTPYVASLRVYEPIDAFAPVDQLRWDSIPMTALTGRDEQLRALKRTVLTEPPMLVADGAHLLELEGKKYIAPWSTAARCWAALETFKGSLPTTLAKFFLPGSTEEAITINVEREGLDQRVPHIITANWTIPPRWFSLFSTDERLRGNSPDGAFTVMRTSIANAKQRCIFTHQAVIASFGTGPIEEEIADLLEWLSLFHADSIVECDYGGLADYLEQSLLANGEPGLEADTSIEDIHISLAGLSQGDGAMAGQGYERLISRWRRVAAFEQAM